MVELIPHGVYLKDGKTILSTESIWSLSPVPEETVRS